MVHALVTDAQHRAVVAGIRGLGRSGLRVLAVAPRRSAAGLWSRYAAARAVAPDPRAEPSAFVSRIHEIADRDNATVVYPGTEEAIDAVVSEWSAFRDGAMLPYPGPESLHAIRDKSLLPSTAAAAGVRTPRTLMERRAEELADAFVPIPCVIKPADPGARSRRSELIRSRADLERALRRSRYSNRERLIVQEWIPGPLTSIEVVLSREGVVVERFQQIALRTWPPRIGSISLATSVEPDATLLEQGVEVLRRAGYWGLAQLDFVRASDGPVLIDVNPRFYACLPLALASGVNLSAAWHDVALGLPAGRPTDYKPGMTFRWLEADLVAGLRGERSRLRRVDRGPTAGAMWAPDDPVAAGMLGAGAIALRAGRVLGRGAGGP
jgi:predicted ATP-grasp superfamily ATP-dependent carboligase